MYHKKINLNEEVNKMIRNANFTDDKTRSGLEIYKLFGGQKVIQFDPIFLC